MTSRRGRRGSTPKGQEQEQEQDRSRSRRRSTVDFKAVVKYFFHLALKFRRTGPGPLAGLSEDPSRASQMQSWRAWWTPLKAMTP